MAHRQIPKGEVISFGQGRALLGRVTIFSGLLLGVFGFLACMALLIAPARTEDIGGAVLLGLMTLVLGSVVFHLGIHWLRSRPRLLLGPDRLQFVVGSYVTWEVRYGNIDRIALLKTRLGLTCVGIQVKDPSEAFRTRMPSGWVREWAQWKSYGFDVTLSCLFCEKPPDQVLEACWRCVRRSRLETAPSEGGFDSPDYTAFAAATPIQVLPTDLTRLPVHEGSNAAAGNQ